MSWPRVFSSRLRGLFSGARLERQMEEELRLHLEMQTEDNLRTGMSPAEARFAAMRRFGAMEAAKERCRDYRSFAVIEMFFKDTGYAWRALKKNRAFTAVAVTTLALAIGANTAIFSVVQAVLLQPLPYSQPERLVHVWNTYPKLAAFSQLGISPGDFYDFQKQARSFSGMAAYIDLPQGFNLTGLGEPERLEARYATSDFFPLLGVSPIVGHGFTPAEDKPGSAPTVLITHRLWQKHFGTDPEVVGRTIQLDGRGYTLVGVLPASFQLAPTADIWMPVGQYGDDLRSRVHHPFSMIGRLGPGATISEAQAELDTFNRQQQAAFPDTHKDWKLFAGAMENSSATKLRPVLMVLFGAVTFVLLIACANVVNLVLARNAARQKEVAVRIALGASTPRLIAQLLTESMLLTGMGALIGMLLAGIGLRTLTLMLPANLAAIAGATLNWWVLGFTAVTSLFAGMACGLIPALQTLKQDSHSALKAGGRASDASVGRRIRDVLVIAETALAIVLLLGATLLIRSFYNTIGVDPGFRTEQRLSLGLNQPVTPPGEHAKMSPEQQNALAQKQTNQFEQITERIQALPGVRAVGAINVLPLGSEIRSASRFVVEGQPVRDAGARPMAETRNVSLGYFAAMGIPLTSGRWFNQQDYGSNNILVNQEMAHRFWPGQDALGRRINLCSLFPTPCWLSIVGIVGNVHQYGLDAVTPSSDIYFAGGPTPYMVISANQNPTALARSVVQTIHEKDPNVPVTAVMSLEELLSDSLSPRRLSAFLLAGLAILAIVLAAVGIYGVMNYVIGLRMKEIGMRVALGARSGSVWRLVTFRGIQLALAGILIGLGGALAMTKILTNLVYGVKPDDPVTILVSALALASIVVLACHIPARRATRVDPMVVLRED